MTPSPEKYRDRLLRAAYTLAEQPRKSLDFLVVADEIFEEIHDATCAAYFAHFTELLGRPPTHEDWYRFEALAAKRPTPKESQ